MKKNSPAVTATRLARAKYRAACEAKWQADLARLDGHDRRAAAVRRPHPRAGAPAATVPTFNARDAAHEDVSSRLADLGVSLPVGYERHDRPLPPPLDPRVLAARQAAEAAAQARREALARELEAGRIDGRSAVPVDLEKRLRGFGLDMGAGAPFRPVPPAPPPVEARPLDPEAARQVRLTEAERAARALMRSGRSVDVRELDGPVYAALLRLRGLSTTSSGPVYGPRTR